jgi:serine protease Do
MFQLTPLRRKFLAVLWCVLLSTPWVIQAQQITTNEAASAVESQPQVEDPSPATVVDDAVTQNEDSNLDFLFTGKNPSNLDQLRAMQSHVRDLSDKIKAATVNIRVGQAQGSGVIVSPDGMILTAAHVIVQPGLEAVITLADSREVRAKTLGVNKGLDSGMLKINGPTEKWPYLDLGVSDDLVNGEWVVCIGHPEGLDKERGMVLRVGRVLSARPTVLQTDCVLVGGDSGGPLVNMNGELVGIHSRIGTNLWANLHVPVDVFLDEWDKLADGEMVGQKSVPYLGITLVGDTNEIETVEPGTSADRAGLEGGDVILRMNGENIAKKSDVASMFSTLSIDQKIEIVVDRDGTEMKFDLTVGRKWE